MDKRKTKVYTYTRVSTAMQIDGYSLDAQKSRMKAFAEYNDYEIVREYEDAGKSGKSIEGRVQFSQMMDDIKEGKDGVSYVLVFKLSRFGRNAADVLSTLQIMQDFGVNLICVEDGIDSSKDAGKLMISVLSAVAEIERENIRVQTMEGRIQKAREGKWNGGFAPYGYQLVDGKLEINEEEAVAIRVIFDQYVNTNIGSNGIAKYLENHGIRKIQRQNGKNPLFDAHLVRLILRNPVYCGKIAYGRRRTEKVHGTRNDYHLVEQENYLLVDGLHEAIVSEEIWQAAQVKLLAQAKKYEHVNKGKDTRTHLLSGIVKCPVCGAGMYGNKCIKHKKDGTKYKDFYYYGCKHRTMTRGHKCDYRKQINEELLDDAVAEIIVALVSKPKFATMMQEKINMKVDTSTIDQEVANHEKQLRQYYSTKSKLMEEIDSLDPDDRHYIKRKADLDDRLYRMYDKIEEEENLLVEARAKKQAIEAEKLTADNIYKVLIYFEKLYGVMNDVERRRFIEALISEIQIFPERQPNGQWLKSIKFKLPIIGENMELSLDNDKHVEARHVEKGYGDRILIHDFSYIFLKNDRVAFIGANGCGKTTLMKLLTGKEQPDSGEIIVGQTVKIGYYAQEVTHMDPNMRVIDYVREVAEFVPTTEGSVSAAKMLERFLFEGSEQYTEIGRLSGGEKRRLNLLRVLMGAPNVLILDEPTNDLDITTLTVLEDYLDHFEGIVIIVSHDRYFLDRTVSRIFAFEEGGHLQQYEGNYSDYALRKSMETQEFDSITEAGNGGRKETSGERGESARATWKKPARKLKFTYQEQKDYDTIEQEMADLEDLVCRLDEDILKAATDFVRLNELSKQKEEASAKLEEKMERWMYLEEKAARIEAGELEENTENE